MEESFWSMIFKGMDQLIQVCQNNGRTSPVDERKNWAWFSAIWLKIMLKIHSSADDVWPLFRGLLRLINTG